MNNSVCLMFSSGRDSFLSACKLLDDPRGYHVYMVTYDNGCMYGLDDVQTTADKIIQRYGSDRAKFLGVFPIIGIAREFFMPYFNMSPEEQDKKFPGMTPSQCHCLMCRTAMYIHSILLCKACGIPCIAEGSRKSKGFVVGLPGMAQERYLDLVKSQGLDLLMPVYDLADDWDRHNELIRRGFVNRSCELKCCVGVPINGSVDQRVIDGTHAFYDDVILPKIRNKKMLSDETLIRSDILRHLRENGLA